MGVYKRGDTWGISYFHNGKRIRRPSGPSSESGEGLAAKNFFGWGRGEFPA